MFNNIDDVKSFINNQDITLWRTKNGDSVLHKVCDSYSNDDIILYLLKSNASTLVNVQNNIQKDTPLHYLLKKPRPSLNYIKLLLDYSCSLQEQDIHGNTPFLTAPYEDQLEAMEFIVNYCKNNKQLNIINQQSPSNYRSALHCASARGSIRIIDYLLTNKADINILDKNNQSPIFSSVIFNKIDSFEYLLGQDNINIHIRDKDKKLTILHYICAKRSGYPLAKILIEKISQINLSKLFRIKNNEGTTALFSTIALQNVNIKTLELLLEHNARPNDRDKLGGTILFVAVKRNIIDAVKIILKYVNVNLQDIFDKTAISYTKYNSEIYKLLINANAQVDISNNNTNTSLNLTNSSGIIHSTNLTNSTNPTDPTILVNLPQKRSRSILSENNDGIDFKNVRVFNQIGSGAFGRVHRGEWLGTTVAIKFFTHHDSKHLERFKEEIQLLKSLNHPNIVNSYGDCISFNNEHCMLMEYLPLTLSQVIKTKDLVFQQIISIMKAIASGMVYLHAKNIIHRDLKPSNILLTPNLEPKIADFGISRLCNKVSTMTSIGTPLYMAPEIINDKKYDKSVDVYAFGLIFLQLFTKKKIYHELGNTKSPLNIVFKVVKQGLRPQIPENVDKHIAELIKKCWSDNPNERPSFEEITKILESISEPCFFIDNSNKGRTNSKTVILSDTVIL